MIEEEKRSVGTADIDTNVEVGDSMVGLTELGEALEEKIMFVVGIKRIFEVERNGVWKELSDGEGVRVGDC